jgi:hypothetical protein
MGDVAAKEAPGGSGRGGRSAAELVEALLAVRLDFTPAGREVRRRLMGELRRHEIDSARDLRRCHAALQFAEAYPDDPAHRAAARRELARIGAVLRARAGAARRLAGSGFEGTAIEAPFSLDLAEWLLRTFPGEVEIAWDEDSAGEALDDLLTPCALPAERDGLQATEVSTRRWIELASGGRGPSLGWLVRRLRQLGLAPEVMDRLYEPVELPLRWRIGPRAAGMRFPARPIVPQREPVLRAADPGLIHRRLPAPRPLSRAAAAGLVDLARCAIALRSRETDAVTWTEPRGAALFRLERGVDVALFAMSPPRRLTVESYFGYLAGHNRVPVAYGGAWVIGDRAEIGINVFDAFRGGESAYLFVQLLRVYHHCYGVRRFSVDPYQFGAGNTEAIRSGAFWFYYRLGFRPLEPRLAALAEREWSLIREGTGHRTPARVLRALARGRIALDVGGAAPDGDAPDAIGIGLEVTGALGERFGADRAAAERWALGRASRLLRCDPARLSPPHRVMLARWSPIVALLPGLEGWPAVDRRSLLALIQAKAGPSERGYALRLGRHRRLLAALAALGRAGRAREQGPRPGPAPAPARR